MLTRGARDAAADLLRRRPTRLLARLPFRPPPINWAELASHLLATPERRLLAALSAAVPLHVLLLWQVHFRAPKPASQPTDFMEVVLVPNPDPGEQPEHADYLAQANRRGGDLQLRSREADAPPPSLSPLPRPPEPSPVESRSEPSRSPAHELSASLDPLSSAADPTPLPPADQSDPPRDAPPAASDRRRHKYISAATREHVAAAYMDAWRRKVERVGNFHYPEEARRKGIYGSPILDVALTPDGRLEDVSVVRSSGRPTLDTAAIRIVRLAAPYAPFPAELRAETDILHITRTWRFYPDDSLSSH
jgi:protein TonB